MLFLCIVYFARLKQKNKANKKFICKVLEETVTK